MQFLAMINAYFEQGIKRLNVGLEDQNCLYLLGNISKAKTFSELVLRNRCHRNRDYSKRLPDPV